jgi:hypothetical protein
VAPSSPTQITAGNGRDDDCGDGEDDGEDTESVLTGELQVAE